MILKEFPEAISSQMEHLLQGFGVGPFSQFKAFARMRAVEVFPTPRGPENKNECASRELLMALINTRVMCSCPVTASKVWGLHLRASTRYDKSDSPLED
jgi:hypothetical protein